MKRVKRIGILTAGGDCPGLNAAIRAVGKAALRRDIEVVGIHDGFLGLIESRTVPLDRDALAGRPPHFSLISQAMRGRGLLHDECQRNGWFALSQGRGLHGK